MRHDARVLSILELLNVIANYEPSSARVENERREAEARRRKKKRKKKKEEEEEERRHGKGEKPVCFCVSQTVRTPNL